MIHKETWRAIVHRSQRVRAQPARLELNASSDLTGDLIGKSKHLKKELTRLQAETLPLQLLVTSSQNQLYLSAQIPGILICFLFSTVEFKIPKTLPNKCFVRIEPFLGLHLKQLLLCLPEAHREPDQMLLTGFYIIQALCTEKLS